MMREFVDFRSTGGGGPHEHTLLAPPNGIQRIARRCTDTHYPVTRLVRLPMKVSTDELLPDSGWSRVIKTIELMSTSVRN